MTEHKADLSITKIQKPDHNRTQNRHDITKLEKYKKLKMTEHKTGINITKIDKYKKKQTKHHFFDGTQNSHEHY